MGLRALINLLAESSGEIGSTLLRALSRRTDLNNVLFG